VKGSENGVENPKEQRYRSMGKKIQGPVQNTIWTRRPGDLQIPDGFENLIKVG
jgi:hypothetical protein